jgi:hypothetical protein
MIRAGFEYQPSAININVASNMLFLRRRGPLSKCHFFIVIDLPGNFYNSVQCKGFAEEAPLIRLFLIIDLHHCVG